MRYKVVEVNGRKLNVEKPRAKAISIIAPIIAIAAIIAIWQFGLNNVPEWMIPKPASILRSLIEDWTKILGPAMLETLKAILIGYVIVVPLGFVLAVVMTQFRVINNALNPYVILCVVTPLIVLVPMLIVLIGYGFKVRLIAVIIQSFSIVMMNSATGFNNVDPLRLELMKVVGSTRIQKIRYVSVPSSWVDIFTGMRLGAIFATTAAISAEFAGGNSGLGYVIMYYTTIIQTRTAFAGIVLVAVIGIAMYSIINFIERKVIKWQI